MISEGSIYGHRSPFAWAEHLIAVEMCVRELSSVITDRQERSSHRRGLYTPPRSHPPPVTTSSNGPYSSQFTTSDDHVVSHLHNYIGSQRTTLQESVLSFRSTVLGTELRPSGLVASTLLTEMAP